MKLGLILPLAAFLALGALLKSGIGKDPSEIPSPLIAKPAPAFDLPLLADQNQRLSRDDLMGKAYLLNVWGSWCPACRIEHPYITQVARSGRVPVYGLNWKDEASQAQRWLNQFGDPYVASLYDPSGRTGIDFGVYGAPETFLISADGTIVAKHIGPLDASIFEEKFAPHLDPAPGS